MPIKPEYIPEEPGIYKMLNKAGELLYVGKAKNLKKRVSSYFQKTVSDLKTMILVSQIDQVETIVTPTEHDAFVLESQLIKTFKPKYNIMLKDDKYYPYIKITSEPFPRLLVSRRVEKDDAYYFGPYPSIGSIKFLKKVILDVFPLRDCKQAITLHKKEKKCILLDLEKCLGPCIYKSVQKDYALLVQKLILFLQGKDTLLLKELTKDMQAFSAEKQFEKAAKVRDMIQKLQQLTSKQHVDLCDLKHVQIWAYSANSTHHYMLVQEWIDGKLLYQHGFYESITLSKEAFTELAFLQLLNRMQTWPDQFICNDFLSDYFHQYPYIHKKTIICPKIGGKKDLLDHAVKNATLSLSRIQQTPKRPALDMLRLLQDALSLESRPLMIWGIDISHLQGTHIVGSCVCFAHGKPLKQFYRKFDIRSVVHTSDDPKSIAEVLKRRILLAQRDSEVLPSLILIDGGKGQLNAAYHVLSDLGMTRIDLISLAKKEELVFKPGLSQPIRLGLEHPALQLLQQVRDEAHRFALRHQRSKRKKQLLSS